MRIIYISLFFCIPLVSFCQLKKGNCFVNISGSFKSKKSHDTNPIVSEDLTKSQDFSLGPGIQYVISKRFIGGLQLNYSKRNSKYTANGQNTNEVEYDSGKRLKASLQLSLYKKLHPKVFLLLTFSPAYSEAYSIDIDKKNDTTISSYKIRAGQLQLAVYPSIFWQVNQQFYFQLTPVTLNETFYLNKYGTRHSMIGGINSNSIAVALWYRIK